MAEEGVEEIRFTCFYCGKEVHPVHQFLCANPDCRARAFHSEEGVGVVACRKALEETVGVKCIPVTSARCLYCGDVYRRNPSDSFSRCPKCETLHSQVRIFWEMM